MRMTLGIECTNPCWMCVLLFTNAELCSTFYDGAEYDVVLAEIMSDVLFLGQIWRIMLPEVSITHVASEFQHADFVTKPLPVESLQFHRTFALSLLWCLCVFCLDLYFLPFTCFLRGIHLNCTGMTLLKGVVVVYRCALTAISGVVERGHQAMTAGTISGCSLLL